MDPTALEKYRRLTRMLSSKTKDGKISWTPSIFVEGFESEIGNSTVNISIVHTGNEVPDYLIRIFSRDLTLLESFTDVDIRDTTGAEVDGFASYFQMMEHLYNSINRKLSGADKALDDLLGALEEK